MERYQLGDAIFGRDVVAGRPPAASRSYAQTGPAAVETRLDFALRRCAFFWPDEGQFEGAGWSRTTKLDGLGVLLLRLDQKTGLPTEIRAIGETGKVTAKLTSIQWQDMEGRPWPKSFEFWAGGSKVWTETVTGIERDWLLGDPWFLPSDRVGDVVGRKKGERLRMRARGPSLVRSIPIPKGQAPAVALETALHEWSVLRAKLRSPAEQHNDTPPPQLVPAAALVIGAAGEAKAFELEMSPPTGSAPPLPGWSLQEAASEWVYLLDHTTRRHPEAEDLTQALAAGRALLEAPDRAAATHGLIRLRFAIVDRGPAGIHAVQKRLTRAAQEGPVPEPDQASSPKTHR